MVSIVHRILDLGTPVQLYSEKEKQAKEDLLNLMTCYDLQFVQHRTPEGLSQYILEPDVYSFSRYPDLTEVKQLPYSVKQMLAREVTLLSFNLGFKTRFRTCFFSSLDLSIIL